MDGLQLCETSASIIYQLSAYPIITAMYKILSSIAVTSCSAECTLSRARIIKNRLRSTMQKECFSSLTFENIDNKMMINLSKKKFFRRPNPRRCLCPDPQAYIDPVLETKLLSVLLNHR
jgi:hypothetical protein